jgi:hypothetical protein
MEIVVEQVQPQDVRWLRGLQYRDEVRRDGFDILSARLLRMRPTGSFLKSATSAGTKL